jgi:5'-nucleotidase
MPSRRRFLLDGGLAAASLLIPRQALRASEKAPDRVELTILHTNDVHSRLEPFPADAGANAGRGGIAARASLISAVRREREHVLLLDAGDIFQGTPYFNIFGGEPEIKAMTLMGYDASIMGNHDFDSGIGNFATQLGRHASFPIVMCNYDFSGTPMENLHMPWKVIRKGPLRIGITGVGIELAGLVPDSLYGNTKYNDPIREASRCAELLKKEKKCDMVVCLSHLGDMYKDGKVSDEVLAKESEHIDLVIGGHTHRFFDVPRVYRNRAGSEVVVNQVGWGGLRLGRLDYTFIGGRGKKFEGSKSLSIGKKQAD